MDETEKFIIQRLESMAKKEFWVQGTIPETAQNYWSSYRAERSRF